MRGKEKCRILKQIRAEIAAQNDIDLVIEECTHKGECRGACPRCEAEVRYLEAELEKRRRLRKTVALAGVSAGITLALSGCAMVDALLDGLNGPGRPTVDTVGLVPMPTEEVETLEGEVAMPDYQIEELEGDVPMYADYDAADAQAAQGEAHEQ